MNHVCHALECNKHVSPEKLMCLTHWRMVPKEIQDRIVKNFNPKQCSGKVRPHLEWLKAAREAINFVSKAEGRWIEPFRRDADGKPVLDLSGVDAVPEVKEGEM